MKKAFIMILAALLALCAGCSAPKNEPEATPAPAVTAEPEVTEAPDAPKAEGILGLETTDVFGDRVAFSELTGYKVIMVNFWETWCPPCMGELPDLEAAYEKYKDSGFIILGVYSSSSLKEVLTTVKSIGTTYPVLAVTEALEQYQTQYVPTTVFFNSEGELLTDEPVIGSMDGEQWDQLISSLLENG